MKQEYMNRENYEKVAEILGNKYIFNCSGGKCEDFTSDTKIDIDNSTGRAAEVLERIVAYADALLYDAYHSEPEPMNGWKTFELVKASDAFDFIVEDTRYTLEIDHMVHDADDMEWKEWSVVREKILNAEKASIEYWYSVDVICPENLVDYALNRVLDDLLANGRLADCVSVQMRIFRGDVLLTNKPAREMKGCSYLWMNGVRNGQYLCGEIPFESNEDAIHSCSGWQGTDDNGLEVGLFLRLHPKTSPELLKRVREVAKSFEQKIDCEMKLMMSYNDFRNDYIELHVAIEDGTVSCVDKAEDDKQQRNFPDLRVYFTPEEKQMLLDYYPTLSRKFIQYADSSYTEDDLERIRFLWTLALLGELEGFNSVRRCHWDSVRLMNGTFMNVFRKLPEKIRFELYGLCSFDLPENPKDYFRVLEEIPICNKVFFDKHSGIGDLSLMDDELYASIRREGYFVQVTEIHLKDIDDVHMMCDFMNKLKEIEQLAQTETGKPISCTEADERFNQSLSMQWWDFLNRNESAAGISEMTRREYHEQASKAALMDMNRLFTYNSDGLTFEPEESSQWARLRFRLEDGKYIYEIA